MAAKKKPRAMSELMTRVSKENLTFEWKCINSVRCLSAAQPQNANSGHPGEFHYNNADSSKFQQYRTRVSVMWFILPDAIGWSAIL